MSDVHLNFSSVSTFNTSLYSIPCKHGLRNRNSAVCVINLIPCRTFSFSPKHILLTRWQMQSLEEEKSIAMSCSSLYRTKLLLLILQRLVGMIHKSSFSENASSRKRYIQSSLWKETRT